MTGDTSKMRDAASQIKEEEKKYRVSMENIDKLITNTLGQYWVDEAYEDLKSQYTSKNRQDLQDLDTLLIEFNSSLNRAADDLDAAISSLRKF